MLNQHIHLIDQFYNLYSSSLETGYLTSQDWQIIEAVKSANYCSEEQHEMLQRLLYSIDKGRIIVERESSQGVA